MLSDNPSMKTTGHSRIPRPSLNLHPAFSLSLLLLVLNFASCACNNTSNSSAGPAPTTAPPPLTIVHIAGKISEVPRNSVWPASIKVGKPFECWAVLDNRVKDSNVDPHTGLYKMRSLALNCTVRLNNLVFSASSAAGSPINVTVNAGRTGSLDGYIIAPLFGTTLPQAPKLAGIATIVNLQTHQPGVINTDALPLRVFPVKYLAHDAGGHEQLYLSAFTANPKDPNHNQLLQGRADTFEIFHAWGDTYPQGK